MLTFAQGKRLASPLRNLSCNACPTHRANVNLSYIRMKIYFYHTEDVQYIYDRWKRNAFPGHFLYGATHLADHGIEMVMHRHRDFATRIQTAIYTAWRILTCRERLDAVNATHYQGLEIIIFMRALGLFRPKTIVWLHQPVIKTGKRWRDWIGKLFYKGMDRIFLFSRKLYDDSLSTGKARPCQMRVGHWGPDLDFYDRLMEANPVEQRRGFISTGRERRDFRTLVEAFNATGEQLDIYLNKKNCGLDYEALFGQMAVKGNVRLHYVSGYQQDKLCLPVHRAACVVICCMETNYTVGLTTVVEAMALGLPIICSRNPQIPIDFDKEGCGISVPYYDTKGWADAIRHIASHPAEAAEMGRRGRLLAEKAFNDKICAAQVAETIKECVKGNNR